jgi:hypothetical protein
MWKSLVKYEEASRNMVLDDVPVGGGCERGVFNLLRLKNDEEGDKIFLIIDTVFAGELYTSTEEELGYQVKPLAGTFTVTF